MFFVFPLLFLSVYVSDTNNFVLKNESQGDGPNVKPNEEDLVFQDVPNDSSVVPKSQPISHVIHNFTKTQRLNPKSNKFTRKLSDDIPIKRHIPDEENDEEDIPSMFTSTTSSIATSTLESKRKWPVVELLSHSYDFVENAQYIDKLENEKKPFFHNVNKSKIIDFPPKFINSYLNLRKKHPKDKPAGLRSLPQQNFPGPETSCEKNDKCGCLPSKTSKTGPIISHNKCTRSNSLNSLMNAFPLGAPRPTSSKSTTPRPPGSQSFDMGYIAMGVPMGVPMGIPAGYPGGYLPGFPGGYPGGLPAGYLAPIPAGPVVAPPGSLCNYQEVPKHKKPCKKPSDDYLYYDDDDDDHDTHDDDDEHDYIHNCKGNKKKHRGDILIDVEYDIEQKPNPIPKCRDNTEDLANDIFKDIRNSYSDSIIKNCYCCSASCSAIKLRIVFLFLILVTFY